MQSSFETMSFGLSRHLPLGREMFDGPKLVRSNITTRSLRRSCMCMAAIPTLGRRRFHFPPAANETWRVRRSWSEVRKRAWNIIVARAAIFVSMIFFDLCVRVVMKMCILACSFI